MGAPFASCYCPFDRFHSDCSHACTAALGGCIPADPATAAQRHVSTQTVCLSVDHWVMCVSLARARLFACLTQRMQCVIQCVMQCGAVCGAMRQCSSAWCSEWCSAALQCVVQRVVQCTREQCCAVCDAVRQRVVRVLQYRCSIP